MKAERQQLIDDLLGDQNRRDAILRAGSQVLRRRRQWRVVRRSLAVLALVVGVGLCFKFATVSHPPQASAPTAKPALAHQALTDEELLALFPDTPVALATLSDGTKRLIFPRAGDDQRFVTRF